VEPVGEVCVLVIVDLITEDDCLPVVSEKPDTIVGRLPRPEVEDGEGDTSKVERLTVRDGAIGERA
jgi:hypothetical protein